MDSTLHDIELIDQYLAGSLSADQQKQVAGRINHDPAFAEQVSQVQLANVLIQEDGLLSVREELSSIHTATKNKTSRMRKGIVAGVSAALLLASGTFVLMDQKPSHTVQVIPSETVHYEENGIPNENTEFKKELVEPLNFVKQQRSLSETPNPKIALPVNHSPNSSNHKEEIDSNYSFDHYDGVQHNENHYELDQKMNKSSVNDDYLSVNNYSNKLDLNNYSQQNDKKLKQEQQNDTIVENCKVSPSKERIRSPLSNRIHSLNPRNI
jgi:hypothetical protein